MRRGFARIMSSVAAVTVAAALVACGAPAATNTPASEPPPSPTTTTTQLTKDSILAFENDAASAQLVSDMDSGKIPKSCDVLYDQMGARPSVTVTDEQTIREVYARLALMRVVGTSDQSITDSYHHVSFELQDGSKASFAFEGEGILVRGKQSYTVIDRGDLWSYVRYLQDIQQSGQPAATFLPIELKDEDNVVLQCPTSAPAGTTVRVTAYDMLDVVVHIAVNDDEHYGKFTGMTYEFVMPDSPVTVHAWVDTDEYVTGS